MTAVATTAPEIVDLDGRGSLPGWLAEHAGWQDILLDRGAIVFRGAGVGDVADFDSTVSALVRPSSEFSEETSPRTALTDRVFTSTEYPAPYPIQFHNEFSYRRSLPDCLVFACLDAPDTGGSTPIADCRKVLATLPPDLVDRFADGVRYVRNFVGLGVPWQKTFGTESRADVDEYCARNGIDAEWSASGLHTRQFGTAVTTHRVTGERAWCNHVLNFNIRGVKPAAVRAGLVATPAELRPTNSLYADGSELDEETISAIRTAYESVAFRHEWRRGDVLIIDNILTAHARDPFTGTRRVLAGMGHRAVR
ncbi:TauD/TfdA family dioxygenase [Actinophytocola sp.]|jgi:hypothetical protein|uniref:TauD/TfdA family dioxygenase n=1 Tax=Actinophytocola sp. TaxID=1872138 RepID=UPI002ED8E07B